jgi:hypothetical protein
LEEVLVLASLVLAVVRYLPSDSFAEHVARDIGRQDFESFRAASGLKRNCASELEHKFDAFSGSMISRLGNVEHELRDKKRCPSEKGERPAGHLGECGKCVLDSIRAEFMQSSKDDGAAELKLGLKKGAWRSFRKQMHLCRYQSLALQPLLDTREGSGSRLASLFVVGVLMILKTREPSLLRREMVLEPNLQPCCRRITGAKWREFFVLTSKTNKHHLHAEA